jgi:dihydroorotate dehydrogenase electron transfer subunit
MNQVNAEVLSNNEVIRYRGAKYFLMQVKAPAIASEARPGQFCMLNCGPDTILRRPISIHTISNGDVFFLYSVAEENNHSCDKDLKRPTEPVSIGAKGKPWLSHIKKGNKLDIIGPLGKGFHLDEESKNVLLAAGGIGIAPLRFLAEESVKMRKHVTILFGARCKKALLTDDQLPKEVKIIKITERYCQDRNILTGLLTKYLPDYFGEADRIYACGPKAMLETMSEQIKQNRITKPVQVSLEVRMGCGTGACYGCSIRTTSGMKRVCREGPVFDIKDIIWQEVCI